jgi:hypothetical protein
MPVGENLSLIVSDIFHIPKYDTNEVDREQKTLENKLEVALLSLYSFEEKILFTVGLFILYYTSAWE